MTAAAARPPLFDHLVASRPERDRSFGAGVVSLAFHAVFIGGAVLATMQVRPPDVIIEDGIDEPPIQFPALPIEQKGSRWTSSETMRGPEGPLPPDFPFPEPIAIPPTIPTPGPITILPRELSIARPAPDTRGRGPGSGDREGPGGFQPILTQVPRLLNRADVQRTMLRLYPRTLLEAGIGGTTLVWLRLDENGRVAETQLKLSSGQRALDDAALDVGRSARFSPAYNGETPVRVWVELPVVFAPR